VQDGARFGLYVIGDEILSGRRADRHLSQVIALLGARGLALSWARFLPDDRAVLAAEFSRSLAGSDIVFSCGGIGATPDDHTRQAVAEAMGARLALHPFARDAILAVLRARGVTDPDAPDARRALQMGEFPEGAQALPNPYNGVPGFTVGRHHFVPGFPVMAWPMIESLLDGPYAALAPAQRKEEHSLLLYGVAESSITPLMLEIEERFPGVRTFSLPSVGEGGTGPRGRRHVELGVKGWAPAIGQAWELLRARVAQAQYETGETGSSGEG